MSARGRYAKYSRFPVDGSVAYDLNNPAVWPEYDYGESVDLPDAPVLTEEVVGAKHLAATQAVSVTALFGLVVAVALVVISLLARVQLNALSNECAALESSIASLESEQSKLLIAYESAFNLTEIEDYAVDTLGMGKPRSDQIYYISGDTQDRAVLLGEGEDVGFADRVGDLISSFASYFTRES